MITSFVREIENFSNPRDEIELRLLDEALTSVSPSDCKETEFDALLGIFERFPEEDGFGIFWGIVHLLEACKGYEASLINSVRRMPVEFNILMINRLLNAGVQEIDGVSLMATLKSVVSNPSAIDSSKNTALRFIDYQIGKGQRNA